MQDILMEMLSHYGLKEYVGPTHNPEIMAMFEELGFSWIQDDETSWCSAALNYFCKKLGYEYSGKLDARSWLKMPVKVLKPQLGDIVILWRDNPKSWKGHVGLFITQNENVIYVLGGNQGDQINISPYPKNRVLGYRQVHKLDKT